MILKPPAGVYGIPWDVLFGFARHWSFGDEDAGAGRLHPYMGALVR